MTERETPDAVGFLIGGLTDDSSTVSAPPAVHEPEKPVVVEAPVYRSRREMRAAGGYQMDAAAPAASGEANPAPARNGAASPAPAPSAPTAPAPQADPFVGSRRAMRAQSRPEEKASRRPRATSRPAPKRRTPSRPATRNPDDGKSFRQRIFGVGVMVLVGGLFAVLALPAYADNNASSLIKAENGPTQKIAVAEVAASAITTSSRDSYTATSASDLKKLYANAIRQQNLAAYLQSGAKQAGDDYPWFAELSRNQGGGLSPLNYYYRECVDFVAWRLNRDAGFTRAPFKWTWSTLTPSGGNASQWKSAWAKQGWPSGATPVVGSVAWFPYNHVAYVAGILNNGQVLLEEYNWSGQHVYGQRVINPGDAYYLYAPK